MSLLIAMYRSAPAIVGALMLGSDVALGDGLSIKLRDHDFDGRPYGSGEIEEYVVLDCRLEGVKVGEVMLNDDLFAPLISRRWAAIYRQVEAGDDPRGREELTADASLTEEVCKAIASALGEWGAELYEATWGGEPAKAEEEKHRVQDTVSMMRDYGLCLMAGDERLTPDQVLEKLKELGVKVD